MTGAGLARECLERLKERNWRACGAFDVRIGELKQPRGKGKLSIAGSRNRRWAQWSSLSQGCYLLRTNLTETDPATPWERHILLTEGE